MVITTNRIFVHPDFYQQFEDRFSGRANMVDTMPGFISFQLLRPMQEGLPYVVMTTWETKEHFTAWTESEAFKEGHAKSGSLPREAFTQRNQIEIHEVV